MFVTPYNYDCTAQSYETDFDPSETIEGMSNTIDEIVSKFMRGVPLEVGLSTYYDDDNVDFDDIDPSLDPAVDLVDVTEAQLRAQEIRDDEAQRKAEPNDPAPVDPPVIV